MNPAPAAPPFATDLPEDERIYEIPVDRLEPDPYQPRLDFNEQSLQELTESIAIHGLLTPLLVRPMQGPNSQERYWVVAGERRLRAAQRLGLKSLPCRIRPCENTTDAVIALAENVHREGLGELEKAEALLRIKTLTEQTWEQIAEMVRLSPDYIKRLVGLLKLEPTVKEMLREGKISARTAIALKPLRPKLQLSLAEAAVNEEISAEEIRERAREYHRPSSSCTVPTPGWREDHPPPEPACLQGDGTVLRALRTYLDATHELEAWLSQRNWEASTGSPLQREALHELTARMQLLQQRLTTINEALETASQCAAPTIYPVSD